MLRRGRDSRRRPSLKLESLEHRQLLAVVISEFMADNETTIQDEDGDFSDWVEIRNTSGNVSLDGWYLTDDASDLTKWRFPAETLSAGEHLLVFASNKDRRVAGDELHTTFRLSNSGEYLALVQSDGVTIEHEFASEYPEQNDDVSYGLSADLSETGYFVNPTPGTANVGAPVADPGRAVVISEIMYHPASNNVLEEYIEIHNRGSQAVNLHGWRFNRGIDFTFPNVTLNAGSYLVVAADTVAFDAAYPGVANVIGGWSGQLSNQSEAIQLVDESGARIDRVTYADDGNWATRAQVSVVGEDGVERAGWDWLALHDGGDENGNNGKSLELVNLSMPNQHGQNWASSVPDGGTPGAVNSTRSANTAPLILDVKNLPIIPRASDPVVITAAIDDELPNPNVQLHFRLDGAPAFSSVVMRDDGQGDDREAGDGTFTTTLTPQVDGAIVEFYVWASDSSGNERTWPAADTGGEQSANAFYQVDDMYDPDVLWQPGTTPRFYHIMRAVDREDFLSENFHQSDAQKNATFVVWNGTGVEVRHTVGIRYRGSFDSRRIQPIKSNRINLLAEDPWSGVSQLNVNATVPVDQISGSSLWRLSGLPTADASVVRMLSNGEDLSDGRVYNYLEAANSDMASNQFTGDSGGNLYRGRRDNESPPGGQSAGLQYFGPISVPAPEPPDNPYVSYQKLTNSSAADWTDVAELAFQLNNCGSDGSFVQCGDGEYPTEYIANVEQVADIDQWLRSLAMSAILDNNEGGLLIGDRRGDDYMMYRGVEDPRFKLVMHDLDTLYANPTRGFFRFNGVPALRRLVNHPEILPRYYAQLEDLAELVVSEQADTAIDESLRGVTSPGNIDSIKSFLDERTQFILSQIPRQLTIDVGLPIVGEFPQTTNAALSLNGTTPASQTHSVLVNGQPVTSLPGDGTWQMTSSLTGNVGVETVNILATESEWSYLDDASDQGVAWREANFDDGGWATGTAPLGYGDGDETTEIGFVDVDPVEDGPQRNATTYFRNTFNVANPADVQDVILHLHYDDAAIVYINGVEAVVTPGLESGAAYDTYASETRGGNVEDSYEAFRVSLAALNSLVAGENSIAVEIHQASPNSSDISFDAGIDLETVDPNAEGDPVGIILNPGINRVFVEAFDGPNGNGQRIASEHIDVWYDGDAVHEKVDLGVAEVHQLRLRTRDSYLPGTPTLVRVEALDFDGQTQRDLWDAEVHLTVDNPRVRLSTHTVTLVNGQGSALVTVDLDPTQAGTDDFTLTAWYRGMSIARQLVSLSDQPVTEVSGTLAGTMTNWSGVVHVTDHVVVPAGTMLNILPGTLVLIDGDPVGADDSTSLTIEGRINVLGTFDRPVTFTSSAEDNIWGQIDVDGGVGIFDHAILTRAGNAVRLGHTSSGAAIRMRSDADVTFRDGSITDLRGKSLQSSSGDLVMTETLLSRSVMGPEIESTSLQFVDSWIVEMAGVYHRNGTVDDNDGIYLHNQQAGQEIALRGGVVAQTEDDGIDLLGSDVTVDDYIVRDIVDKGVSQLRGEAIIRNSLIVNSEIGVNTKGNNDDTPHTVIDNTTIANVDVGIKAEDKDAPDPDVVITFDVTNSIIRVNEGGDAVVTDYDPADIHIDYSNVAEAWPGTGNSTADPEFIDAMAGNFHPNAGAVTVNAGDPLITDSDGTRLDQGYYKNGLTGEFQTTQTIAGGNISADTVLSPYNGPFHITGDVTVDAGTRFIVLPGTSVYVDQDVELIVAGELIAAGSPYQRIRFTADPTAADVPNEPDGSVGLPDGPPRWDGIHFQASRSDVNRITHADIVYAEDRNGAIGLIDSNALLDNITVAGTHLRMVYGENVSLDLRNSVFPDMFAANESPDALGLDNISEHVKVIGDPPEGGRFVIQNNVFGTNKGHNDVIDADSDRLPNPILEVRDNVFLGAGDEELDLGGDVYVTGNLFTNIFKDDETSDRGYANAISTGDAGTGTTITVARNFFVDVDHAINLKRDTGTIFENNSVYKIHSDFNDRFGNPNVGGVINLFVDEPGGTPGDGAYVEANIVWDAPRLFSNPDLPDDTVSRLEVHNNLIDPQIADNMIGDRPETVLDLGMGNLVGNGRFVELATGRLGLDLGSAARGSGPIGQDMGADIRDGIWITGEPSTLTTSTSATLTVGGPGFFAYRYRVDGGPWSAGLPIGVGFDPETGTVRSDQIELDGLADGPHVVEVLGQDFAGIWQTQPTRSRPWIVAAASPSVRINEVLASNSRSLEHEGTTPDYIELFNDGTATIDLSGMSLTDDASDPRKFVFPAGTTLGAGEYLLVYADSEMTSGLHAGFKLSSSGEVVYLFDTVANGGGQLDAIEFGIQLTDLSIGRVGIDGIWALNQPTAGTANVAELTGNPQRLSINEWFASGDVRLREDFIELYNADDLPVDIGGLHISDHPNPLPEQHRLTPLSFVAANGFVKLVADDNVSAGADHLNFRLSADREHLGLFDQQLNKIDQVMFFAQTTDVTQGRVPDGAADYEFSILPTPGLANEQSDSETMTVASIAWDDIWRYDESGNDLGEAWRTNGFNDADWLSGPGLIGFELEDLPQPLMTEVTVGAITYYFRNQFELPDDVSNVEATFSTAIDDGAVVYVNGSEVIRVGMPEGPIAFDTFASRNVNEAQIEGLFTIPSEFLVPGDNVIAVEVHQRNANSGDIVFGLEMQATQTVTSSQGDIQAMRDLLAGLRITEIMYNTTGPGGEYLELTNVGDEMLPLDGVRLDGGVDFTFPALTLGPGDSVVVADDLPAFLSTYGNGVTAIGQYDGNLSDGGEEIILRLPEPYEAAVLRFDYDDQWYPSTDGGGTALELVDPPPIYRLFDEPESWQPSQQGGSPGYDVGDPPPGIGIVINEVLTHTDPPQTDAIELLNTSNQVINISGWYLSDARGTPTKFQIPVGTVMNPRSTVVFDESDFNPTLGMDPNDFALDSARGDQVYLWQAAANGSLERIVDFVEFGSAANGESFGRVPSARGVLPPMTQVTLGCQNSPARVGPVVISEINYHPSAPSAAALGADPNVTSRDLEFVELYNPTTSPVGLANWRLRGGVDLDLSSATFIGVGQTLIVVSFDAAANAALAAAFRAHYGLGAGTPLVGGYTGQLSDSGERVVLQRPDAPPPDDPAFIPRLTEDEVQYATLTDWPDASGNGQSLQRTGLSTLGSLATAWNGATASPGAASFTGGTFGDLTGDGAVDVQDIHAFHFVMHSGATHASYDLTGDGRVNLADLQRLLEDGMGRRMGDANLNGQVDATDFGIWRDHSFQAVSCQPWTSGDFNGDGVVDGSDFNIWNDNKFQPVPAAKLANFEQPARQPRAPQAANTAGSIDDGFIRSFDAIAPDRPDASQPTRWHNIERDLSAASNPLELAQRESLKRRARSSDRLAHRRLGKQNETARDAKALDTLFAGLEDWLW